MDTGGKSTALASNNFVTEKTSDVCPGSGLVCVYSDADFRFVNSRVIIGNQAFQNGRCYTCFSLGLEAGQNLLTELKCSR